MGQNNDFIQQIRYWLASVPTSPPETIFYIKICVKVVQNDNSLTLLLSMANCQNVPAYTK